MQEGCSKRQPGRAARCAGTHANEAGDCREETCEPQPGAVPLPGFKTQEFHKVFAL